MKILFVTWYVVAPHQEALRRLGHEVIFYDLHWDREEEYRFKNRHFQMYSNILDYADEIGADILYLHDPLNVPEYLLLELMARPNFRPKIVFHMFLREASRSTARALAIKKLLDLPQVARAVAFTMLTDAPYPPKMVAVETNFSKIKNISEPFNEKPPFNLTKKEAREHLPIDLKDDDFVILWSGRWVYVKGADIFINAARYIGNDFKILAHKNLTPTDLEGAIFDELRENHPNTVVIEYDFEQMKYVYCAADIVVCSHRRAYEYSNSGVPGMAALARVPIVAPDFCYFNEIVNRFHVGTLYVPEDTMELAKAIDYTINNYGDIMKHAQFEKSVEGYINFEDIPVLALEGLE
jgi:glycosyltransferase involved in cell wall biosynthesis